MYKLFVCLSILFYISSYSQTKIISGFVKDILNNPLEYANVLAKPTNKNVKLKYSITDEKGYYELKLLKNETYNIDVHFLGFNKSSFKIDSNTTFKTKNIKLTPSENQLEEVIIESLPIMIKEDTITYKVKSFITGTERKLKQVLKRLPGIEVDKKGNVFSNGKKIKKLLVEDKPFFGGNTKLAVENIPADAINKVEVIDNYSEVSFLKGLTDSEDTVINIKLKKDKKEFVFGDVKAGLGNKNHYNIHSGLFYYSPKSTGNLIMNSNNVGEKTLTFKDYMNFNGGIGKMIKDPKWYNNFSDGDFFSFTENNDFKESNSQFGALNLSKEISDKVNISGFTILSKQKTVNQNNLVNQNFVDDIIFSTENKINKNSNDIKFGISKLVLDYKPNSKEEISFNSYAKITDNNASDFINSVSEISENTINKFTTTKAITIKQNLEWHKKISKRHTFTFNANYNYHNSNPKTNWQTNFPILDFFLPLQNDIDYNINQIKSTNSNRINFTLKHYWVLNNINHIYTTIGNHFNHINFSTEEIQLLSNESFNNFNTSGFGNNLHYQINNSFLEIQHKIKYRKTTFKTGFGLHQFNWVINQSDNIENTKFIILPNFSAKVQFRKSEILKFNYKMNVFFANAPKYVNQLYLQSYQSYTKGNSNLSNEIFHTLRLNYYKFSLYRKLQTIHSIQYKRKNRSIRNEIQIEDINIFSTPIISSNPETSFSFNNSVRKGIKNIYAKIKANYTLSKYNQIVNEITSENKREYLDLSISFQTKFDEFPNFDIGFNKNFSFFNSGTNNSKFTTEEPFIILDYDFDDFIFNFNYTRSNYENSTGTKTIFETSDASIFYQREDSPFGFEVSAKNIFDTNFKRSSIFSNILISDSKTFIQPRVVLFTVSYKL